MTNWFEKLAGGTQVKLLGLLRRSRQSIGDLANALGLTDNAVRTHVAVLERDGVVEAVGSNRQQRGKPARLYALTPQGEELFPKAYALVLGELIEEISRTEGRERAIELLRAVGRRAAAGAAKTGKVESRVQAAGEALRGLGADLDVSRTSPGWRIQGYACPLSAITASHPEVCELARSLVEEVTGQSVVECCERGARPRCAFEVAAGR